jgi:1,4-alpha-glucan branching enzyme
VVAPGKKLLFMGGEIAQEREWNHDTELDWFVLDDPAHAGVQRLVRDLNRVYREQPSLHARDTEPAGFRWMVGDDRANSVFAYQRFGAEGSAPILVVCNMTPVPRHHYRIGVRARAPGARSSTRTRSSTAAAISGTMARSTPLKPHRTGSRNRSN